MKTEALFWLVIACVSLLMAIRCAVAGELPEVPGATNPAVTQSNIRQTVCKPGWTKTVRPPVSYTDRIKQRLLAKEDDRMASHYELDHLVSLQLGGAPSDLQNLWLEPYEGKCGARVKDVLETNLKRRVCNGSMTLQQAQEAIRTNWINAFNLYVGNLSCN